MLIGSFLFLCAVAAGHLFSSDGIAYFRAGEDLLVRRSWVFDPPMVWGQVNLVPITPIGLSLAYWPGLLLALPLLPFQPAYPLVDSGHLYNLALFYADPVYVASSTSLFVGATLTLLVAERVIGYNRWEMAYPGPLVLVQTIGLIGLVRSVRIPERWQATVASAAKLTFGVYLVHVLFVQGFAITLNKSPAPHMLALVVTWVATVALSFGAVAAWHRVRGLERILG